MFALMCQSDLHIFSYTSYQTWLPVMPPWVGRQENIWRDKYGRTSQVSLSLYVYERNPESSLAFPSKPLFFRNASLTVCWACHFTSDCQMYALLNNHIKLGLLGYHKIISTLPIAVSRFFSWVANWDASALALSLVFQLIPGWYLSQGSSPLLSFPKINLFHANKISRVHTQSLVYLSISVSCVSIVFIQVTVGSLSIFCFNLFMLGNSNVISPFWRDWSKDSNVLYRSQVLNSSLVRGTK